MYSAARSILKRDSEHSSWLRADGVVACRCDPIENSAGDKGPNSVTLIVIVCSLYRALMRSSCALRHLQVVDLVRACYWCDLTVIQHTLAWRSAGCATGMSAQ